MTATEFQRIPKDLLDIPSVTEHPFQQMAIEEDKFYRQVMRQVLGREPVLEDAKDFTVASHVDYPDIELFAYKSTVLGRITKGWATGDITTNSFTWNFEPGVTTFKNNGTI